MQLPSLPQPGRPIEAAWAKQVIAYLKALTWQSTPSLKIDIGPGGTTGRVISPAVPVLPRSFLPLQLEVTTDPADPATPPSPKIRVYASTVAGGSSTDLGFTPGDSPGYYLTPVAGVVQAGITIDDTTGAVTSRWIECVASLTADVPTTGTYYVEIGTVAYNATTDTWTVSNSRYGPIGVSICRNWFASSSPYYGVSWS